MTKHTKGPWRAVEAAASDGVAHRIESADGILFVARVRTSDAAEQEANARLIAAAPALLDALQTAYSHLAGVKWSNRHDNPAVRAAAAIKAAGGTLPDFSADEPEAEP